MKKQNRIHKFISGGCHTYSRGDDQFPSQMPNIFKSGKNCYLYDGRNNKYLDYGMGLRSIGIGYSNSKINNAAIQGMKLGNNLTRASQIELLAAKKIIKQIKSIEMVKFAKNGSNVTTAAIKLARAFTKKKYVLCPTEQPFFSFDDWFIGTTKIKKGIPKENYKYVIRFKYNDIENILSIFNKYKNQIACVLLEPSSFINPCTQSCNNNLSYKNSCIKCPKNKNNFLKKLKEICNHNKSLLIFDEMITGFRWHEKGAQHYFDCQPDLSTFGKAIANGFSVSLLGGRKEIMELGGINNHGAERVFLLSSTHGAEMSSLNAMIETINFYNENKVCEHIWNYGNILKEEINLISKKIGISEFFYIEGNAPSLNYVTKNKKRENCMIMRTIFQEQMLKSNIIIPWISQSFSHKDNELDLTLDATKKSLLIYSKSLHNPLYFLQGKVIKPVFRKFN